jgi:hypothetical protein
MFISDEISCISNITDEQLELNSSDPLNEQSLEPTKTKKLSKVPIRNWTLPKCIYKKLVVLYPSLVDKSNETRELEWYLVDKFLFGHEAHQLYYLTVLNICGKGTNRSALSLIEQAQTNLNGLFSLKAYLDTDDNVEDLEDYDGLVAFANTLNLQPTIDLSLLFKEPPEDNTYIPHQLSRLAVYIPCAEFEQLKQDYIKLPPSYNTVFVLTGKDITTKAGRTMRKWFKEQYIDTLQQDYEKMSMLPGMVEYCNLVNELTGTQTRKRIVSANIEEAERQIHLWYLNKQDPCASDASYMYHKRVLERIRYTDNTYRLVTANCPRVFDLTDQNVKREIRQILFDGCKDIDLSRSQLTIITSLSESTVYKPVIEHWINKEDMWGELCQQTGFPKDVLKQCTYTICYGGSKWTWTKDKGTANPVLTEEEAKRLSKHSFFKNLYNMAKLLQCQIDRANGVDIGGVWISTNQLPPHKLLARKIQWIESMIIYEVCKVIKANRRITLIGAYHDGLLCYFNEANRVDEYLKALNQAAQYKANSLGINYVKLEIK